MNNLILQFIYNVKSFQFISFAASGDDPQCSTPKRKNDAYNQGHLATPGGTPTMHDDFEMGSPTWPRTPASPVRIIFVLYIHFYFTF